MPQANPPPPVTTIAAGDHTEATFTVQVPVATHNSQWRLEAILNGVAFPSETATLTAPPITAVLSCCAPCTVAPGATVVLTVAAPDPILTTSATVVQRLNGVPYGSSTTIALSVRDLVAQTISGFQSYTAPASPGTWTFDVSINGYPAQQTPQVTVATP